MEECRTVGRERKIQPENSIFRLFFKNSNETFMVSIKKLMLKKKELFYSQFNLSLRRSRTSDFSEE